MESLAEKNIRKLLPHLKAQADKVDLPALPLLLRGAYSFEKILINDRPYLVINVKDKTFGPRQFKRHALLLEKVIDYPQIWYLKELHFHKVQRMMKNGMNFIVEGKQVHLPSIHLSIRPEEIAIKKESHRLNSLSVNMLIREVLKGDLSGKNRKEISEVLKVNQMSVVRAVQPLLARSLCSERKQVVAKYVYFNERNEIWDFLKAKVPSPVKETVYMSERPAGLPFSGLTALSQRTMLAGEEVPTFAIHSKVFNKQFKNARLVIEDLALARIEIWDRPPILIDESCINPIDIYLVNKDEVDERVQIELENLLNEHGLKIG